MDHDVPLGWEEAEGRLTRSFTFSTFSQAWAFLSQVALAAERADHHPEIWNEWNRVRLSITTHDAGNTVTVKDIRLASAINELTALS